MNVMYSLFMVIQIGKTITKVVVARLSQSCQVGRHCDFLFAFRKCRRKIVFNLLDENVMEDQGVTVWRRRPPFAW